MTLRVVYRPVRIFATLHEGERLALMELVEMSQRAPAELIRHLIVKACKEAGIVIGPPPPVDPKILTVKLAHTRTSNRKARPKGGVFPSEAGPKEE